MAFFGQLMTGSIAASLWLATGTALKGTEAAAEIAVAAGFSAGEFVADHELAATYRFGWSGVVAAHGDVRMERDVGGYRLSGAVATVGLVRLLWTLDGEIAATADKSLAAIDFQQKERYRDSIKHVEIQFDDDEMRTWKWHEPEEQRPPKPKVKQQPGINSILSAVLAIRSQPLRPGEKHSLLVTPANTVYLLDLTVLEQAQLQLSSGKRQALKLDLNLRKITKKGELKPHGKLGKTTLWLADDSSRIPLRVESEVFIGFVFAELIEPKGADS